MRRLLAIVAMSLTLYCVGAAPVAAAWPHCLSCGPSAVVAGERGGMHCGPGCGHTGGGIGGSGGGMSGSGGGMGGGFGGMGAGFGGWNPFMALPRPNCPEHRRKTERSQCPR
jgi:ribosomal protein S27AE